MSLNVAWTPHVLWAHTHWHTFYSYTQQQTHTHTLTEMLNPISLSSRVRRAENPINVTVWITAAQSTGSRRVENQWICQPLKRRRRKKRASLFQSQQPKTSVHRLQLGPCQVRAGHSHHLSCCSTAGCSFLYSGTIRGIFYLRQPTMRDYFCQRWFSFPFLFPRIQAVC